MRVALLILVLLVSSGLMFSSVYGWSNGGFKSNPEAPDYGTHVVINEVELNPPGDDNYHEEWVELLNPTPNKVDIGDWTVSTTAGKTSTMNISTNATIPPYGYWVVSHTGQWLDNKNESIVLRDASGSEVDRTPLLNDTYYDAREGYSWSRYIDSVDTDSDSDWTFQSSTKGTSSADIDGDGRVDMWDLASIAKLFGRTSGDILWNLGADINGDHIINMADLGIAARHFGEHYP